MITKFKLQTFTPTLIWATWILLVSGTSYANPKPKEGQPNLESKALRWAVDYLYTSVFLHSYLSFKPKHSDMGTLKPDTEPSGEKLKIDAQLKEEVQLKDFALYALKNARSKGFQLELREEVEKKIELDRTASTETESEAIKDSESPKQEKASQKSSSPALLKTVENKPPPAFYQKKLQEKWIGVQEFIAQDSTDTGCKTPFLTIAKFASNQKKMIRNHQEIKADLLNGLKDVSLQNLTCIAIALMGASSQAKKKSGYEPINLLRLLNSKQDKAQSSKSLKVMLSIRLLQHKNFSGTLKIISRLLPDLRELRLAYDQIQRIYSFEQKGSGQVAIQSL